MKDLGNQHYQYDMNGTKVILSGNNERHGVISLTRPEFNEEIVQSESTFLLNIYRLTSRGEFRGLARKEPFSVSNANESGITLQFPQTEVHPLNMEAEYAVHNDSVIDLTVSIEAKQELEDYEVFISSYMHGSFEPYVILPIWPGKEADEDMLLYKVEDQPLLKGYYLYFPRDDKAAHALFDGRWIDRTKNQRIIEAVAGPMYGKPIAIMSNGHLSIIQMAETEECPGTLVTYSSDDQSDPIYRHHATYFSLFGSDLTVGEKRQTRIRQVIRPGKPDLQDVLELYEQFTKDSSVQSV